MPETADPATRAGARPARAEAPREAPPPKRGTRAPRPLSERGSRGPKAEPPAAAGPMRLQRALARAGVSSRREADAMVAAGRVTVNGQSATVGQVVDPARDVIAVDGHRVEAPAPREWLVLNKPPGVLTTRDDPEGRPTVFDLVPNRRGLTYVGRLDYMTEGVLLFTTDGEGAHALTHPSREVERTYVAVVRGNAPAAVRALRHGIDLDDGPVRAASVEARPLGNRRWELELTITEGRTREVRRVCEALDLAVERLLRVRFGPVRLGTLPTGATRPLNGAERSVIDTLTRAQPVAGRSDAAPSSDRAPRARTRDGASSNRAPSDRSADEPRPRGRVPGGRRPG